MGASRYDRAMLKRLMTLTVVGMLLAGCQHVQKYLYTPETGEDNLLFTSFRHKQERDLYLLHSRNGFSWENLGSFLKTTETGLRDPMIAQGPDGTFHLVYTTGRPKSIGYASSRDLITWTTPRLLPVMQSEPECRNAWAPELFYDHSRGEWLIHWSSTVGGRFTETKGGDAWNNRLYACTTKDFQTFGKPYLFHNPGYAVIDGAIAEWNGKYYLFYKNETVIEATPDDAGNVDPSQTQYTDFIEVGESDDPRGPWTNLRRAVQRSAIEAPAPIVIGDEMFVYFDFFNRGRYGAMSSKDMQTWVDRTPAMTFPEGHRHGSPLRVSPEVATRVMEYAETHDLFGRTEAAAP